MSRARRLGIAAAVAIAAAVGGLTGAGTWSSRLASAQPESRTPLGVSASKPESRTPLGLSLSKPDPAPPPAPAPVPGPAPAPTLGERSFLAGAVRCALPAGWVLQDEVTRCGGEGVALYIPCAPLDETAHSANVNLLAEPNVEREDLATWSARRLASGAPRRIVEERVEPAWRTVVSAGEDGGERYVVVERFGATARARVHVVAAFPVLPEMGEPWLARAGEDIDRFLGSVALAGAPVSSVRVAWGDGTLRLGGGR